MVTETAITLTLQGELDRPRGGVRVFRFAARALAVARLSASRPPCSLAPGWYLLDARLAPGDPVATQLVIDYGHGYAWLERLIPRLAAPDGSLRMVLVVKQAPRSFGILAGSSGQIPRLSVATLRPVGRARALFEMLAGIRRAAGRIPAALAFLAFAKTALRHGRQTAANGIVARYETAGRMTSCDYAAWQRVHASSTDAPIAGRNVGPIPPGQVRARMLSVLMAVDPASAELAGAAIRSVQAQSWTMWQLCIACAPGLPPAMRQALDGLARGDSRIAFVETPTGSDPWSAALSQATGTHCARLECGDSLAVHALRDMAAALAQHPDAAYLYSDHDEAEGVRGRQPYFKPDWSPDIVCRRSALLYLAFIDRGVLAGLGAYAGADPYDLALRACDAVARNRIVHVPRVLYHRRQRAPFDRGDAEAVAALRAHLARTRQRAQASVLAQGLYRLTHELPDPLPTMEIVVPTRDQPRLLARCIEGLLDATDYPGLRVRIIDNGSSDPKALRLLERLAQHQAVTVQRIPGRFNFSRLMNRGVSSSDAEVVCLLNDDVVPLEPGWLREMVSQAMRPGIGAVGALLCFPDGTVQHAGVVTGVGGVAGHAHYRTRCDAKALDSRMTTASNATAVTAACLVVTRACFEDIGGFDERLPVCYNDVDFCMRIRAKGYFNVWTPFARLCHHESATRGPDDTPLKRARHQRGFDRMRARWGDRLERDPAYNPNLSLYGEPFELAYRPRAPRLDPPYPCDLAPPPAIGIVANRLNCPPPIPQARSSSQRRQSNLERR